MCVYDTTLWCCLRYNPMVSYTGAARYADRQGGYCRVIKEDLPRRGDSAEMAIIELV